MNPCRLLLAFVAAFLLLADPTLATATELPLIEGEKAVASVNGQPVSLEDLLRQIDSLHEGMATPDTKVDRPDPTSLLDRLIQAKLILQEARSIGLDELPEVVSQLDRIRLELMKNELIRRQTESITEVDENVVNSLYDKAMLEWQIDSVLFETEGAGMAFAIVVNRGGNFQSLAAETIAAGEAKGGEAGVWVQARGFRPEVAEVISKMEIGSISNPIKVDEGYTVVHLLGSRIPEIPTERQRARDAVLQNRKQTRLREYTNELRTEYADIDEELFDGLDFEAEEPGFESLKTDKRVVATIKGSPPVTVADLAEGVKKKLFHGIERAAEQKRINAELKGILDRILLERITLLEGERLKIEETPRFQASMQEQEERILFNTFLTKVVSTDVDVAEVELKAYYEEHMAEFTSPEMMRIDALAFARRSDAEGALDKLRNGADLQWMRENATGQATRETHHDLLIFRGTPLITDTLPPDVREAITGAKASDYRFYAQANSAYYVLYIREVLPPTPQAYEDARETIAAEILRTKQQDAVDDWTTKLRAASEIEVFATGKELYEVLGLGIAK